MIEIKFTHNMRLDSNNNISFSTTHIVSHEEDAKEAGELAALLTKAFREGYAEADLEAPSS